MLTGRTLGRVGVTTFVITSSLVIGSSLGLGVFASGSAGAVQRTSAAPSGVPLTCAYGDTRTPADASVQPGLIVATHYTYFPTTYTAYTVATTGHLQVIGASTTIGTTDHLVAAWQNSTDCSGLSISRNAWVADSQGAVFGESTFSGPPADNFGDMAGKHLNQPIVGMSPTADGEGYWLVASDGGIFTFGDARFFGSTGAIRLNKPIVGMAVTPTGDGYWLVASDGGIFTFGNAPFFGSLGGHPLNAPIEAMIATPDGHGYWMVASDGGVFCFGDATFHGSMGGQTLSAPIAGMIPNGSGYTLVGENGQLYPFG